MTREEAKAILEMILACRVSTPEDEAAQPEYEDLVEWVEDACKTIANEAPQFGTWQPIETAPKDGTVILICHDKYKFVFCGKWTGYGFGDGMFQSMDPTHWMPLPKLPEEK